MDGIYANLGLTTVISRLGLARTASDDAGDLGRHLRQIEAAMPAFNLDPSIAHIAAEIAAFEQDLSVERRVALIMLIVASMIALSEGSTRLPVTGPQACEPMARILGPMCAVAGEGEDPARAAEMARAIAEMLDAGAAPAVIARSPEDYRPLLYLPPYLYHQRIRAAEVRLANRLRPLLDADGAVASAREIAAAIMDVCNRPHRIGAREILLSSEQCNAVRSAAMRRLALISGGPGTGKTSIVLAIVRMLVRLGIRPGEIALAAPTGKAAHRLGESIRDGLARVRVRAAPDLQLIAAGVEPLTMHRLLEYSPGRGIFLRHRNNPLPAMVVIVDESSMLDLNLMQRLAAALRPEARLVLLGDADQLPSVAAGAVFRDLVAAVPEGRDANDDFNSQVCTRLTQSYRTNPEEGAGRAIFTIAKRINQGAIAEADETPLIKERAQPASLRFEGVELIDARQSSIDEFLDRWYDEKISDDQIDALASKVYIYGEKGFDDRSIAELQRVNDHLAASRILCVTRVLATGAGRINAAMHLRVAAAANRPSDRTRFLAGEPVMVVRNDYERNLFNGDQGIIVRVKRPDGGESPMAVFMRGDRCAAFHPTALGDALELCYATTIHKAQGSEFDCVAVVMPDRSLPILTREVLYTAVSRARKSVVLAGSIESVQAAVTRKGTRYSGLAELLGVAASSAQA
jgi:exodeoxyribonuclease V alpha subunit